MQVVALTAVFNGALTNVQQRSGSGLWLRFHIATIKQKMAIKDHRKRNKIPSEMCTAYTAYTTFTAFTVAYMLTYMPIWLEHFKNITDGLGDFFATRVCRMGGWMDHTP